MHPKRVVSLDFLPILLLWIIQLNWTSGATLESIKSGPMYQIQVVKGSRAELPCDISTGDPTDRVILILWYKNGIGTPIYSYDSRSNSISNPLKWVDSKMLGGRAHFDFSASPSSLVVDDVEVKDDGLYRCKVDFKKSPTRYARTNVSVIIPPNSPRILSERRENILSTIGPLNEGNSLKVICQVLRGRPPPRVVWRLDKKLIDNSYESPREGVVENTLVIDSLSRKHLHASLTCEASNTNYSAPVESMITLEMNLKPLNVKILGSREPLSADKEYEIVCQSVGARPKAKVTWWLSGKQLNNTTTTTTSSANVTLSTLTFIPSNTDRGKYLKCMSQSPVILDHQPLEDSWQLEIYYTPKVVLSLGSNLQPDQIREGVDVFFDCDIKANPSVYKVVWHHNGVLVQQNISGGIIISNRTLVIQKVKRQQTGIYTCIASNIEGDGESNAVKLNVQYAPVCAPNQLYVYGAARNEEVKVTCRLDAVPAAVTFKWRFNSSGDVVEIANNHVATNGLESSLSYVARTELDYGTLLCWGFNSLGHQKEACVFKVVPAGPPDTPKNCTCANNTSETLHIKCIEGYNGGINQTFVAEVYDAETNSLKANVTETYEPDFKIAGLEPGKNFKVYLYASNIKGPSDKHLLPAYTLTDVAEKRTSPVRPPPEDGFPLTPILAILVGVAGSLVLVGIVAVIVVRLKKDRRRQRPKNVALPIQTSLTDSKDIDDNNPDVIPNNGSEGEQTKPASTPEEGGFSNVHICSSIPYTSNVYTTCTIPRNHRHQPHTSQQHPVGPASELMYAELSAFPRPEYTGGTLPRRNQEPTTVYAQIDHTRSQGPIPRQQSPQFLQHTNLADPAHQPLSPEHQAMHHFHHMPVGQPIGIPTLPLGTPYPTPAPPKGFGGVPTLPRVSTKSPPVIHEEDEHTNAETPLMNDHKESEV